MVASPTPHPVPIPRRTRGQGRTVVVPVRMLPATRDALAVYAAKHESSVSTVLAALGNQVAQGGGDLVVVLAEPSPVFKTIAHQLARIGSNLRQLTVATQAGLVVDSTAEDLDDLRQQVAALRREVASWVR